MGTGNFFVDGLVAMGAIAVIGVAVAVFLSHHRSGGSDESVESPQETAVEKKPEE